MFFSVKFNGVEVSNLNALGNGKVEVMVRGRFAIPNWQTIDVDDLEINLERG